MSCGKFSEKCYKQRSPGGCFHRWKDILRKGRVIRDVQLLSSERQPVLLSEIRGHRSMMLVFAGEPGSADNLLSELALHQAELAANEANPLAIVAVTREQAAGLRAALHLNFEVLPDENGRLHRSVGAEDQAEGIVPAVFITEQFATEQFAKCLLFSGLHKERLCPA